MGAVGTFRIENEKNEDSQPPFNLSAVLCSESSDNTGKSHLECTVTAAVVTPLNKEKPDTESPNCILDYDITTFQMKEISKGILMGVGGDETSCYNTILSIDRNTKRVYKSFTRTKYADGYDKVLPICGPVPAQVLMNCTLWAGLRKGVKGRYCDFSDSKSK